MRVVIGRILGAGFLAAVLLWAGSGVAAAQSSAECVFEGDLTSYLACVAGDDGATDAEATPAGAPAAGAAVTVSQADALPRTGTEIGPLVGIGSALVILGGAVVYGVTRRRHSAST